MQSMPYLAPQEHFANSAYWDLVVILTEKWCHFVHVLFPKSLSIKLKAFILYISIVRTHTVAIVWNNELGHNVRKWYQLNMIDIASS